MIFFNPEMLKFYKYLSFARKKAAEGHLSLIHQIAEMVLIYLYRRNGPGYYHLGRFWRQEISLKAKLRHLSERQYIRQVSTINNPLYQKISQHKISEKAMLRLFNIPTPRFFGCFHAIHGRTHNNRPLRDSNDLTALLQTTRPSRICFKLIEGWSGSGFEAADVIYNSNNISLRPFPNGEPLDIENYVINQLKPHQYPEGRLIEEYCQQHSWYHSVNPTSLNTLRIYAIASDTEPSARIIGGYLRAGRNGAVIDNVSAGGLFWPFNPQTGVLLAGRIDAYDTQYYTAHPDSGIQLEGCRLPFWDEAREIVHVALDIFPNIRFAGLDIAVTENGPCIIELNVLPDRTASTDIDIPTIDMLTF